MKLRSCKTEKEFLNLTSNTFLVQYVVSKLNKLSMIYLFK